MVSSAAPASSLLIPPLLAFRAMKEEVLLTPKPGLVDRDNSGAHKDMDLSLFLRSAEAIAPFLMEICEKTPRKGESSMVLPVIRPVGVDAEKAMFEATGGINTHKGQIFSLGVCTAAAVRTEEGQDRASGILEEAGRICRGITRELEINTPSSSHGVRVFFRSGSKGARGEAEAGFPSVRDCSLPAYRKARQKGLNHEESALQALMHLMLRVDDSNVLHRRGEKGLSLMKQAALKFLTDGGMVQDDAYEKLQRLNRFFVKENISPGGCADLLALTLFLAKLEEVSCG